MSGTYDVLKVWDKRPALFGVPIKMWLLVIIILVAAYFLLFKAKGVKDLGSAEAMGGKTVSAGVDRIMQGLNDAVKLGADLVPKQAAPGL